MEAISKAANEHSYIDGVMIPYEQWTIQSGAYVIIKYVTLSADRDYPILEVGDLVDYAFVVDHTAEKQFRGIVTSVVRSSDCDVPFVIIQIKAI